MTSPTTLLSLQDVTLTHPDGLGRVTAVDQVSLDVGAGEFVVLTGPSGSGKSSLLALAAGLVAPDRGRVLVAGPDLRELDLTELAPAARARTRRERIGLVFQQPHLLASLTVREQLEVMGHLGPGDRVPRSRAMEWLDRVGVAEVAERRPHQLSGGQRQRVAIARALVRDPALLLVDEPTSALDRDRGGAVMALLREVTTQQGTATVVVTHDTDLIAAGDRVLHCVDGRLGPAAVGAPAGAGSASV